MKLLLIVSQSVELKKVPGLFSHPFMRTDQGLVSVKSRDPSPACFLTGGGSILVLRAIAGGEGREGVAPPSGGPAFNGLQELPWV